MNADTPAPAARVYQEPYGAAGDQTNVFLQWKGTDACFDFWCECGWNGHFDGYFASQVACGGCGAKWEMPAVIYPRRCDGTEYDHRPVIPTPDQETP